MASSRFRYITKENYENLLSDLNLDTSATGGFSAKEQNELLDRAVGDLESDLVERFIVPLDGLSGDFTTAPSYSQQKVLNALKSKIRQLVGIDKQKNIVIDSTERFVDLMLADYNRHKNDLLNHKRDFKIKLQSFANDTAVQPVQSIGTARPDSTRSLEIETEDGFIF